MKLLGQFDIDAGNQYLDVLKAAGIDVQGGDVFVEHAARGRTYVTHEVKLFVSDGDFEKAAATIRELNAKQIKQAEADGDAAGKDLLKLLAAVIIIMAMAVYFLVNR